MFISSEGKSKKIGVIDLIGAKKLVLGSFRSSGLRRISFCSKAISKKFLKENDFFIIVGGDNHYSQISKLNRLLLRQGKEYILVQLDSVGGALGPTLGLEGGPCFQCLLSHEKKRVSELFSKKMNKISSEDMIPQALFHLMSVEVLKILTLGGRPQTFDGFFEFDLFNFKMAFRRIGPYPGCVSCKERK